MKSYLDVDYTCFVQLETLKMKAIFKKIAPEPSFFEIFKNENNRHN